MIAGLALPLRPRRARGRLAVIVIAAVGFLLAAGLASAAPKFPPLTGRVVDNANILSPEAETRLTAELAQLEAATGHQMVVATVPDLQGYEIEDFGYQLGRAWGVGRKDQDDGVVFLVAPNQRKVRIEVGYGLEPVLTDALSNVILQQKVLPAFREGQMEAGVVAGTEAVIQQLGLPEDQAKAVVAQTAQAAKSNASEGSPLPAFFILFIMFWIIAGVMNAFGGRRRSGLWWLLPFLLSNSSGRGGGGRSGGGWGGGGGGGGGFSGGGGSFGGGGSSGSW